MSLRSRRVKKRGLAMARLLFALYALRLLAPRLLLLGLFTLGGGLVTQHRMEALGEEPVDFMRACYEVYTQLFFEHVAPLPSDIVLRALFFVMPLLGALVLAEGLFKLGASLVDFQNHRDEWMRIMAKTFSGHVILIGLGHVGFRVLEELRARDVEVVVLEAQDGGPFVEEARSWRVPIVIGDARREALLAELGVKRAAAVVACTDDDLVNLEAALDARALNPDIRLVMRMFDQKMAGKIRNAFLLDSTFSTSAISAPLFAAAALDEHVLGAYRLGDDMMVSIEVPLAAGSALVTKTVEHIERALGVPVVGIHRVGGNATHRFARSETLKDGDAVICHIPVDDVAALKERARSAAA